MPINSEQKNQFKSIGHHLKPILIVTSSSISEGVLAELERALHDHELIKAQIRIDDREERSATIKTLCQQARCELVQAIGKVALLYRKNYQANPKLSNIKKHIE